MAYETVVRMMKEPVRLRKAVVEPRGMAPRAVAIVATNKVAGTGQLSFSFTREKRGDKGTALSRAKAQ